MFRFMAQRSARVIPVDLRERLETARLDLLALFRALDRMDLSATEIPQRLLCQLFELDADFAEALWGLDQPAGRLDVRAMLPRHSGGAQSTASSHYPISGKPSPAGAPHASQPGNIHTKDA